MFIDPFSMIIIAFLWFTLSVIISTAASYRGHSPILFFIISMILSPLIGLGFVWAVGNQDRDSNLEAVLAELREIKDKLN